MSLSHLTYDPDTGHFYRNNERAGTPDCTKGYRQIMWKGVMYKEHRLAWFFHTGKWPENQIDHINGIKDDNRIANLRDVSQTINMYNKQAAYCNSKTGYLGVSFSGKKYVARIRVNKKLIHLGTFDTPELAHQHYMEFKNLVETLD